VPLQTGAASIANQFLKRIIRGKNHKNKIAAKAGEKVILRTNNASRRSRHAKGSNLFPNLDAKTDERRITLRRPNAMRGVRKKVPPREATFVGHFHDQRRGSPTFRYSSESNSGRKGIRRGWLCTNTSATAQNLWTGWKELNSTYKQECRMNERKKTHRGTARARPALFTEPPSQKLQRSWTRGRKNTEEGMQETGGGNVNSSQKSSGENANQQLAIRLEST